MPLLGCPKDQAMYEDVLETISLWNIPLCLMICLLNCVVIYHYYRLTNKLTSRFFLLIAVSDLSTALGQLILASSVTALRSDEVSSVSNWTAAGISLFHGLFGLLGYACSIFFNVVMAVIRTVKICDPFYPLNRRALRIVVSSHVTLLLLLCCLDLYYDLATVNTFNLPWYTIWFNVAIAFVGHNLVYDMNRLWNMNLPYRIQIGIISTLVSMIFLIPVAVVLLCLVIQLVVVQYRRHRSRKAQSPDDPNFLHTCAQHFFCSRAYNTSSTSSHDLPSLTDWSHVNVTVFLLSLVFVICNSGIAALTIYYKAMFHQGKVKKGTIGSCYLQAIISSTLPLLSALLTPLIIIFRSSSLRAGFRSSLRTAWRAWSCSRVRGFLWGNDDGGEAEDPLVGD